MSEATQYDEIADYIAEFYDKSDCGTEDIDFMLKLIGNRKELRILEPFCGTGRILIPLANAGHTIVGMDKSPNMLKRCKEKIAQVPESVRRRITLLQNDVLEAQWGTGYDMVVLGANCLFELQTVKQQELCIQRASQSLSSRGNLLC